MTPYGGFPAPSEDLGQKPLLSIILPTLNEIDNIDAAIEAALAQARPDLALEVLIADGGSTDGTAERASEWSRRAPVRLVEGGRGGIAGDVLAAAAQARADVIVVMDADLSHPASAIATLAEPVLADRKDVVVGSRYVPGGGFAEDWPLWRRLLSRAGGALAWPLTDIADPMSGFFAVRRDRLLAVDPSAAGFKIGLEVLAIGGDDLRVSESPILFSDRIKGSSKIGLGQMAAYGRRLLALAGGAVSMGTAARFALVGAAGLVLDLVIFELLYRTGFGLLEAHFVSFALATLFNYALNSRWSFAAATRERREPDWLLYLRFLIISLMSLFLRGGVLASAVSDWGWPPELAILLGIAAAATVNYLGSAFFIFPAASPSVTRSVRWRVAAIGIAAYAIALRLAFMGSIDLLPEEAYYWNFSRHLDIGYLDHPPMVAWIIRLGGALFGHGAFGVRFGAFTAWLVAAVYSFRFARDLFGKTTAFVTLLLVSTLPFFFAIGLAMTPDAPLTAAWAAALFYLERALLADDDGAWPGVGVAIGLGLLSKYTMALLGPAVLLFMALDPRSRRKLAGLRPYLACLTALALFLPVIVWNARHGWASFAMQSVDRIRAPMNFSFPLLIVWTLVLLTPVGAVTAIVALMRQPEASRSIDSETAGRRRLFASVMTFAPLSVFIVFSFTHLVKLDWTGPLWLAPLPFVARAMATDGRAFPPPLPGLRRSWSATLPAVLLLFGAALHYLALGLPGLGYSWAGGLRLVGWTELGRATRGLARTVEASDGRRPLLVGMDNYPIASELAFYAGEYGGRNAASVNLFGADALMYGYWDDPEREAGRTMILIGRSASQLADARFARRFEKLTPIEPLTVRRNGAPAVRFMYRIGYDYAPVRASDPNRASAPTGAKTPPG